VTRVQVPGAPSYTSADDAMLVPWAAGFASQVTALPLATPPPDPFQAVSVPSVVAAAGSWAEITTEARISAGDLPPSTTSWTLYVDTAHDRTITSADLLHDGAVHWVQAQADRLAPESSLPRSSGGLLVDARLQADGSMLLPLTGPGPARAIAVPASTVHQLLSTTGTEIAAELSSGTAPAPTSGAPPADPTPLALPAAPPAPDCAQLACIALTFDDGPGPYTDQLLDELSSAQAPASFFLVGRRIDDRAATVARMAAAGHSIGNHTWDHPDLTTLTAQQTVQQLDRTDRAIEAVIGRTPTLVRPPYGAVNPAVLAVLGARTDVAVGWSDDTLDWQNRDATVTTQRALALAHRGGIVLMHDIHPSTVQAVPAVITGLRAAGYTLVTVDQLLGPAPPSGVLLEHQPGYPAPAHG